MNTIDLQAAKTEAFNRGAVAARAVQLKAYAISNCNLITGERSATPFVMRGSCGTAWVEIQYARDCKKLGIPANNRRLRPPVELVGQCYERAQAWANAVASHLQSVGVVCYPGDWMN